MKRFYRWLSILMCACVFCTSLPGDLLLAFAEEEEAVVEEVTAPVMETEQEGTDLPELELDAEPDEGGQTENEVPASPDAAAPGFVYARITADALLYEEANALSGERATLLSGGIVLVVDRQQEDPNRAKVAFAYEGVAESGWVDASALSDLTEEETSAFLSGVTEALCYQDDVSWPLPVPGIKLLKSQDSDQPDGEQQPDEEQPLPQPTDSGESQDPAIDQELPVDPVEGEDQELELELPVSQPDNEPEAESVVMTLPVSEAKMTVGETTAIRVEFSDGVDRALRFALSVSGVVSVDVDGVVSAIAAGSADVQVICEELGLKATFSVTVEEAPVPDVPQVNAEAVSLIVGEARQMDAAARYASDNDDVAVVDASGAVIAVGAGKCTITAYTQEDDLSAQWDVTVYALPEKLEATLAAELDVGETADVALDLDAYVLSKVTYASTNDQVATVSTDGKVFAVGRGVCNIMVSLDTLTKSLPLTVYDVPETFEATVSKDKLTVGETAQISVTYPEYTHGTAKYASVDETIVTVSDEGVVTAVGRGKGEIRVTVGNVLRVISVESWDLPDSFTLNLEKSVIPVGYLTIAEVEFPEYTESKIVYSSQNPDVAMVEEETGLIYAMSEGECLIAATAENGVCVTRKITVITTGVELVDKYLLLAAGDTYELEYVFNDASLGFMGGTFGSSDTSVATVDTYTGMVKAVSEGTATVTLTLENGETAECYVVVLPAPTRIVLVDPPKELGIGQITDPVMFETYAGNEMTVGTATIQSSNTKVVQVNGYGQMRGARAGTATITLTTYNGKKASFKVTVKAAPKSLSISPTRASLAVGQVGKISYTLTKNTAAGMTFTSMDPEVAEVDDTGRVYGLSEGVCTIEVKTHNNLKKYCTITVNKAPENVTLKLSQEKLGVGMTATASASVDTASNVAFAYEYWTDAPEILSVDASTGKMKALAMGEANVYVRTYNDVTSHEEDGKRVETVAKVKVVPAPEVLDVDGSTFNVIVGYTIDLPVLMSMKDGSTDCMTTYSLTSSSTKIAKIVSGTRVQAVKAGTATITVKTANGLTKQVKVIVRAKPTKVLLEHSQMNVGEGMTSLLRARVYYSSKSSFLFNKADAQGTGTFTSSDPSVVTVDAAGNLTGVKKGEATIMFRTLNGKSAKCRVTVLAKPTEIHITPKEVKLGAGMSTTLSATFGPYELGQPVYTSSDEKIATVDANGKITAISQGEATITATVEGTITDTCLVKVVPAPEVLDVDGSTFNVIVGYTIDLPVLMSMKDGSTDCMTTYSLSSSSTKIAKIVSGTRVQAVKAGTATITVKTANGLTKQVKVIVRAKPTKVVLEHSQMNVGEGMTSLLRARVYYSSKSSFLFNKADAQGTGTFTSSDPSIVTVDAAGNLTGVKKGEATITFRTLNGKSAKCRVTVLAKPTEIHVTPKEVKLGAGMSTTLSATFGPFELGQPIYTSSDEKIATVDANGKITAISQGEATITATVEGNITDTCLVKVVPAPEVLDVDGSTFNVIVGYTIDLPVLMSMKDGSTDCMTTYSLSSSSTKVAKIVSGTRVQAVKAGTATITVKTANGLTKQVKVIVRAKPTKVLLEHSQMNVGEGMTSLLRARVYYSGKSSFLFNKADAQGTGTFTSSDPSIVTVDAAGNLTGVKKGEATITFRTLNGKSAKCRVTVLAKPTEIHITPKEVKLGAGMSSTLSATFGPYELGQPVYTSSDEKIATVDANGKITAISQGEATITATVEGTITDTCLVKVVPAPEAVRFDGAEFNVVVGTTIVPPILMTMQDGSTDCMTTYSLSSSSTKIAKIVSGTRVQAVKVGTATITVKTANGLTASVRLIVRAKPTKVVLEHSSVTLGEGMTSLLRARVYYSSKSNFLYSEEDSYGVGTFASSDPSVVTVDAAGNLTGVKKGAATIAFRTVNGKTAKCQVTVLAKPTAIYLEDEEIVLGRGMSATVKAAFNPYEMGELHYSCDDESIATVDANGTIKAVGVGHTTLRVSCESLSARCAVTVLEAPVAVELDTTSCNMAIGSKMTLKTTCIYEGDKEGMASLTFRSSNTSIATVDANGQVKAVKAGNAVIRVEAQNGVYADCKIVVRKAPTKVALVSNDTRFGVGQSQILKGTVYYSGGSCTATSADSTYMRVIIEDPSIASYDPATGKVTGHEVGRTRYYLLTYNGKKSAKGLIVIQPGAEWIAFNENLVNLGVDQSRTITCDKSAGSVVSFTYASSDPSVAEVQGSGDQCTIVARSSGTATITATTSNGKTAFCEVIVMEKPEAVSFERKALTLGANESVQLPAVAVTSTKGECLPFVTYASSNPGVASVDSAGSVRGVAAGTAVITVKTYNGLSDTCTVTVEPEPTHISVTAQSGVLAVGDSTRLDVEMDAAGTYTFSVDDAEILSIDANGMATALAPGNVVVKVETYNGCKASCTLTVKKVPQSVTLDVSALTLGVGMAQSVSASLEDDAHGTVSYASSDESIAEVDGDGKVTAKAAGTAEIRAFAVGHENVFDTCEVKVLPVATKVVLDRETLALNKGASAVLTASLTNEQGDLCYGEPEYATSDAEVAAVEPNGRITGLKAGEAVITVKVSGTQVEATCTVTVAETNVALDVQQLRLGVGETYALTLTVPENAADVTLTSSNPEVATVTEEGCVEAIAEGEAVITLSDGSETAQCTVSVGKRPEDMQLSIAQKRLAVGKTCRLGAVLLPEGAASQLKFTSSNEAVATVAEDGTVTAMDSGEATITVSSYVEGVSAQCAITVVYAPEMIRFGELDDIVVSVGDTYTLKTPVMFHSKGECDANYTLSISNSTCARIAMENGKYVVRGLKEGSATLRLKTDNGKTATHSVYVTAAPKSVAFEDASIRMGVGETYCPAVRGDNEAWVRVNLQSSDSQVVDATDGVLRAVSEGTATITAVAELDDSLKAEMTVQVVGEPKTMRLNEANLTLAVGEGFALEPVFDGEEASVNVRFTSDNENVLYADEEGYVYAVSVGQAEVTAVAYNGIEATCKVTVKAAPTSISVYPEQIAACLEDQVQLEVAFGEGEFANVLYESDNPAVAQVSDDGLVTFVSLGTTVITVEAFNGMSVEVPVTVLETPSAVNFGLSKAVILKGDRAQMPVEFDRGTAYYKLTSSDPAILRVAADQSVEALKPGVVTVTLQAESLALSVSCEVEVVDALEGVVLQAEKTTLELHETTNLTYQLLPENAIGTGLVRFSCNQTDVVTLDDQSGSVTGEAYGTATLFATTGDGKIGECTVDVLGGKRRMLVAYYFGEEGDAGYLPFSFNNGYSMAEAFGSSKVEGQTYSVRGPMSNAPKSQLFGAIDAHFADATDDDVSVIYICAHGSAAGPTGDYAFALDSTHYVTGSELMGHLEKIKGRVVLIMDSCHSGGVIDCNKSRLDAQGGRISILASSHASTSSSYWMDNRKFTSVDFYTYAILRGLGYNESDGLGGYAHGWTFSQPYADADGNGDVTVGELSTFAHQQTRELVSGNAGKKQFAGHPQQTPQSYVGSMNEDLVLFSK